MFELADYLVGIYKVHDCTQSLTIKNSDKYRILGVTEKEHEKENQQMNVNDISTTETEGQSLVDNNTP